MNKYNIKVQIRISQELKEKAENKAGKRNLSKYIRSLIEEDCKNGN